MYFINVWCLKSLNNRHSTLTLTTIVYRLLANQKAAEKGLFGGGLVSRDGVICIKKLISYNS